MLIASKYKKSTKIQSVTSIEDDTIDFESGLHWSLQNVMHDMTYRTRLNFLLICLNCNVIAGS